MKVGIYDADWQVVVGGAQSYEGIVADFLARDHDVAMIHHRNDVSVSDYAERLGLDLHKVGSRVVPPLTEPSWGGKNPIRRHLRQRNFHRGLSEGYDLFINCEIWHLPVYCHARRGILLSQFARRHRCSYYGLDSPWFHSLSLPMRFAQKAIKLFDWNRRISSYDLILSNSRFSQKWIKDRWGFDSELLYPPVKIDFGRREKENVIICISRICPGKKHIELLRAFRELIDGGLTDWRYAIVGSITRGPGWDDERCAETLREMARGYPVDLVFDADRTTLKELLERASLFWHAKGVGEDAAKNPDAMEHFGIATVEAMAAGCVPLTFSGGGQPEIVEQGASGFLWDNLDTLRSLTRALAIDPERRREMSERARNRAEYFSLERFESRFSSIVQRVMGPSLRSRRSAGATVHAAVSGVTIPERK
jgi:L-malate glycosyltransferase